FLPGTLLGALLGTLILGLENSRVPADLAGRPDLGRIAPGAAADLVWLGPDHRALATWINGQEVFGGGS
ncbi:hypothetical protein AB0K37_37595, partial [Actinomadura sp. NPDC049753]